MAKCDLTIHLDDPQEVYHPGDIVSGRVEVRSDDEVKCDGLKVSCDWRTHGKGNTARGDRGEMSLFQGPWRRGIVESYPFTFEIPEGPYTYHGHYLNVVWEVKATADIPWALDPKVEREITVAPSPGGNLPDPNNLPGWMGSADSLSDAIRQAREAAAAGGGDVPSVPTVPGGAASSTPQEAEQVADLAAKAEKGSNLLGIGCLLFFFLPLAATALVVLAGTAWNVWRWLEGDVAAGDLLPWGFGSLVILLIVGIPGTMFLRKYLASKKLGEVEWKMEPKLARPGDEIRVSVDATAQDEVALNAARVRVEAREIVVRGSGTSRSRYHHTAFEEELEIQGARVFRRGQPLHFGGSLTLPADAPYSFEVGSNEIQWKVHLALDIARWPDWVDSREILVHP